MIGQVIDGCYAGSGVYKLPDKNVLYIQTDTGEKIALSKKNAVSCRLSPQRASSAVIPGRPGP